MTLATDRHHPIRRGNLAFIGLLVVGICVLGEAVRGEAAGKVPRTVEATWAPFDPNAEPLETEVIREWTEGGIVFRHLRYVVGTFDGKKTRVSAHYAIPEGGKNLPGIVQLHGGGQRAQSETVRFWASHRYAAIAVNWGELPISQNEQDPNTDWAGIPAGFVDPKHHNTVTPGVGTLHAVPHPWNSSWLLYSAAARRAITFLQAQREVDGKRIGLTGHSMGGRLTVLTAIDPRVAAASPSVGGSGYLYEDIRGIPGSARHMKEDRALYNRTLDCRHYWPLIRCPLLFLGATNDFNSPMEQVIRGFRSLPEPNGALAFAPHLNHRFTADTYAARVRWFETHLKGSFAFPGVAAAQLDLKTGNGVPRFSVRPDLSTAHTLKSVVVHYGHERDPRVRFLRSVEAVREGDRYHAECPVMELDEPLFAFANVTYDTGSELVLPRGFRPTSLLTVTSEVRQAAPHQLVEAGVRATLERSHLLDDFQRGWQDWALVSADNRHHFNFKTHKVGDAQFFGPRGAVLAFEVQTTAPGNTLAVVMETDQWRGYTGRKLKRHVALVKLEKAGIHQVQLPASHFVTADEERLAHYDHVTGLILTPGDKERPETVKNRWEGAIPVFRNLRWEGGAFAPRRKPYLGERSKDIDPEATFRAQFEKEVGESVEREKRDAGSK